MDALNKIIKNLPKMLFCMLTILVEKKKQNWLFDKKQFK
jgi:hypothetical protein